MKNDEIQKHSATKHTLSHLRAICEIPCKIIIWRRWCGIVGKIRVIQMQTSLPHDHTYYLPTSLFEYYSEIISFPFSCREFFEVFTIVFHKALSQNSEIFRSTIEMRQNWYYNIIFNATQM